MENKMPTACFTKTACYCNLNYHRTPLQYITQNKLLIPKVHSSTGQIISLEWSTETNIELLLSCQETGNSKRIPQIIPIQVTQAAVLFSRQAKRGRAAEGLGGGVTCRVRSLMLPAVGCSSADAGWDTAGLTAQGRCACLCCPTQCTTTARQQETLLRQG